MAVMPGISDIFPAGGVEGAGAATFVVAGAFLAAAALMGTGVLVFVTVFAGAFFVVTVFGFAFGLAGEVFFVVSGIGIPGIPVC